MDSKTVTRADLSEVVRKKCSLSRAQALHAIEVIMKEIADSLQQKREVKVPLFGVFFVRHKKERMGRNPRTLEAAKISERHVVGFRVSRLMKDRVDEACKRRAKKK